jgi:hypothetical protein
VVAEEARTSVITTTSEKLEAVLKLQQACEAMAKREKELLECLSFEVVRRADKERQLLVAREMYEVNVIAQKMALEKMTEKYDAEVATNASLKEALSKVEALHAKEVAKAADREKALAKAKAAHVEMVVKLSEKDRSLRLSCKAYKLMEKSFCSSGGYHRGSCQANSNGELRNGIERMMNKVCAQLRRVVIVCNCA